MEHGGRIFAQRYALDVQVTSVVGIPMWRAMDDVLKRWVGVYLLPSTDSRAETFRQAALGVSGIDDRHVVTVIDVIENGVIQGMSHISPTDTFLGVVVEWVEGQSLDQRLVLGQEVLDPRDALHITMSIARTLEQAHNQGVYHARLRPHNIVFGDSQEIRLTGFGVESAILGADSVDGKKVDIQGLGNLLFAMVTGTWPHGSQDGVPDSGLRNADAVPSMVVGGISSGIDRFYRQTQNGDFITMHEAINGLSIGTVDTPDADSSAITRLSAHSIAWHGSSETKSHRVRATSLAMVSVLIFGWVGWQLLTRNFQQGDVPNAIVVNPFPVISVLPTSSPVSELATIATATDYDPFGDQTENPDKTKLAIDGNLSTAWPTVQYRQNNLAGKPGVGLLLDLGSSRAVSTVTIDFAQPGNSATVFVSDSSAPDTATESPIGSVSSAGDKATIEATSAKSGRYVLVWITSVPQASNGSWQGGIAEVEVRLK